VFLASPSGDVARLFVVERGGLIRILDATSGAPRALPFLDIRAQVSTDGERGLLGMAFAPDYASSRRLFVFYTDLAGSLTIVRYLSASGNGDQADAASALTVLSIPHPTFNNHNGGMLAFGPDGCLYIGTGDGGGSGDPSNNAQNPNVLLGKLLRLDSAGQPCANLVANPFASGGGAPEVWSVGLRNPWRFSFDRQTGDLYIADVGQNQREEVNVVSGPTPGRGVNFGWRLMEGSLCMNPADNCNPGTLTLPVQEYSHDAGACSITGGYVYRGVQSPSVAGTYFYGDFCAGFVNSFRLVNGQATQALNWPLLSPPAGQLTSFAEDTFGELYVMSLSGDLFRIVRN
jgi:glucose/arabinose dehydrogenase